MLEYIAPGLDRYTTGPAEGPGMTSSTATVMSCCSVMIRGSRPLMSRHFRGESMILALTRRLEGIGRADLTLTQGRSMSAGAESPPPQLGFKREIDPTRGWIVQLPFRKYSSPARP